MAEVETPTRPRLRPDADRAEPDEAEERTYEDTDYFVTGGFAVGVLDESALVFGTETGLKVAIDAGDGESLAESEEYTERSTQLPDDPLASRSSSSRRRRSRPRSCRATSTRRRAQVLEPLLGGALSQPIAATLTATADTASFEFAAMFDSATDFATESSLLTELPGESWFAAAVPDLGSSLEREPRPALLQRPARARASSSARLHARDRPRPRRGRVRLARRRGSLRRGHRGARIQRRADRADERSGGPGPAARGAAKASPSGTPACAPAALRRARTSASRSASRGSAAGPRRASIGDQLVAVVGATVDQALEPERDAGRQPRVRGRGRVARGRSRRRRSSSTCRRSSRSPSSAPDGDVDYEAIRPYLDAFATLIGGSRVRGRASRSPGSPSRSPTSSVPGAMSAPGIGIDLIEIERLERALERRPRARRAALQRRPSSRTRAGAARPGRHLAARFAAKEAALKALGLGGLRLHEVEVEGGGDEAAAPAPARSAAEAARRPRGSSSRSRSPTPRARARPWSAARAPRPRLRRGVRCADGDLARAAATTPRRCGRPTPGRSSERGVPSLELMEAAGRALRRGGAGERPHRARSGSSAARATTAATGWSPRACSPTPGYEVEVLLLVAGRRAVRRRRGEPGALRPAGARGRRRRAPRPRSTAPGSIVDAIFGTGFERRAARPGGGRDRGDQRLRRAGGRRRHRLRGRRLDRRGRGRGGRGRRHGQLPRRQARPLDRPGQAPHRASCGWRRSGSPPAPRVEPRRRADPRPRCSSCSPARGADSTKFSSGQVLVAGGSRGLTGAVCMVVAAAIRAGAGYATVAVPAELEPIFEVKLTEVMSVGCPSADGAPRPRRRRADPRGGRARRRGRPRARARARRRRRSTLVAELARADRGAAGARRRRAQRARRAARAARRARGADGAHPARRRARPAARRSTPTRSAPAGSAARREAADARRGDRRAQGRRHDRRRARRAGRSSTGSRSPALATAGTGDVLSGMIAALLARGLGAARGGRRRGPRAHPRRARRRRARSARRSR